MHRDRHPTALTDGRGRAYDGVNGLCGIERPAAAAAAERGRSGGRALCASDPLSAFSRAASSAPLSLTLRPVLGSLARSLLATQCSGGKVVSPLPFFHRPSVRQSTEIRETRVDSFILNNKEGRVGPVTEVRGGSEWESGGVSLSRSVPRTFEHPGKKRRRRDRLSSLPSSIHSIRPR